MSAPAYDVTRMRSHFPALDPALGGGAAHFDGPGGSQTPDVVAGVIAATLTSPMANRGTLTAAERRSDAIVHAARAALGDLLGADPRGIVFGRSMTALTFDLARTMAKRWGPGDEVVVSRLDHDANIRPWVVAAQAVGATVRWADFDPTTGELEPDVIGALLTERTRLVALTAASNLIGTVPDLRAIADLVHATGAWLYVDGVHATAHHGVDVAAIDADFYACSPYKFFGPHCGVVAGRPELLEELEPDKLLPSSDAVPERFELGTLPYELMAGTTAAIDFIADAVPGAAPGSGPGAAPESRRERLLRSMAAIEEHEDRLRVVVEQGLAALPGAVLHSRARRRTPTLLATFAGHAPSDLHRFLGERGVNAPAGSFYAVEAAQVLGLGAAGGLRIGLAPYVDDGDVARLLGGLQVYFA